MSQKWTKKQENRDPVDITLILSLSVLFYYPCGSFLYAMCGCLCVYVWMVVVSSEGKESGSPRQCPISIIPWSVIASKK